MWDNRVVAFPAGYGQADLSGVSAPADQIAASYDPFTGMYYNAAGQEVTPTAQNLSDIQGGYSPTQYAPGTDASVYDPAVASYDPSTGTYYNATGQAVTPTQADIQAAQSGATSQVQMVGGGGAAGASVGASAGGIFGALGSLLGGAAGALGARGGFQAGVSVGGQAGQPAPIYGQPSAATVANSSSSSLGSSVLPIAFAFAAAYAFR